MNRPRDRSVLTGTTIGIGALGLCCGLPAIATLGTLTLGLLFGLGGAVVALVVALMWAVRRRHNEGSESAKATRETRASPHERRAHP